MKRKKEKRTPVQLLQETHEDLEWLMEYYQKNKGVSINKQDAAMLAIHDARWLHEQKGANEIQ